MKAKKILSLVLACVMLVGCVFVFASCSKYGTLEAAFKNAGYEVNTDFDAMSKAIKEELEKKDFAVELHMLTKKGALTSVLIVEFKSTEELAKAYKESATIQGLVKDISKDENAQAVYNALHEAGYVYANCFAIPLSLLYAKDIRDIVKNVK